MRIEMTPKEDTHVRIKYNGAVVLDQVLTAGTEYKIEAEHPKCCGVAELFFVEADGTEYGIGSTNYGQCDCGGTPAAAATV